MNTNTVFDYKDNLWLQRPYLTTETFFERKYLQHVTEDIFTCHSRVTNIVEKYNKLNPNGFEVNIKRLN